MRKFIFLISIIIAFAGNTASWAIEDYNDRFVKNYPPGFHSMWYKAERFYKNMDPDRKGNEKYRWDRFMSRVTGVTFPFYPIPYDWEYGSERTFNLPDYNSNDWR
jgi:hypothetical protein